MYFMQIQSLLKTPKCVIYIIWGILRFKGNDIKTSRREPSLLPVPITELPILVEQKSNQMIFMA